MAKPRIHSTYFERTPHQTLARPNFSTAPLLHWREMVRACRRYQPSLTAEERSFLTDLLRHRHTLTREQLEALLATYEKIRLLHEADAPPTTTDRQWQGLPDEG